MPPHQIAQSTRLPVDDVPTIDSPELEIDWSDNTPFQPTDYSTGRPYQSLTSQGAIEGKYGPDTLAEAARRREGGASLSDVRRDLMLGRDISDAVLERAIDGAGRDFLNHFTTDAWREPKRVWGGIERLPTRAEYDARHAATATPQDQPVPPDSPDSLTTA